MSENLNYQLQRLKKFIINKNNDYELLLNDQNHLTRNETNYKKIRELKSINLSKETLCIDSYTFSGPFAFNKITIPDSVKVISKYAFCGLDNYFDVEILGTTLLEESAFATCRNIQALILKSLTVIKNNGAITNPPQRIYVNDSLIDLYRDDETWKDFSHLFMKVSEL